ncbi:MAG: hypothetical protein ACTHU1_13320 [Arachnia sp.]
MTDDTYTLIIDGIELSVPIPAGLGPIQSGAERFWDQLEELGKLDHEPTADEVETAAGRIDRNYYPVLVWNLFTHAVVTDRNTLAHVVPLAWQMAEFPMVQLDLDEWEELFHEAGFTIDGKPGRRPATVPLLYRGAAPEHRGGWSWTADRTMAEWFRDRYDHDGTRQLYTLTPPVSSVLAIFTGDGEFGRTGLHNEGGESEWVVDTRGLEPMLIRNVEITQDSALTFTDRRGLSPCDPQGG